MSFPDSAGSGRAFPAARLEWLGNPHNAKGVWSLGSVDFECVEWRGYTVRVPPLAVYERIEESRGPSDRVEAIRRVIGQRTPRGL